MGEVRKRIGAARRRLTADDGPVEEVHELNDRVDALRQRVAVLEGEVQENRELNRRLSELTDVVTELLVPLSQRDDERAGELLDQYRRSI